MNEHGMTELHLAAYQGDLKWVENCLAGGMDVNAIDKNGYTPLHWVVDMGLLDGEREEIVRVLVQAGSNLKARNFQGEMPIETAQRTESFHLVQILASFKNTNDAV